MNYYIEQIKEKDCSFACLKMLLAIVHKNKNYLLYPQNKEDDTYSLDDILTYAKKENVNLGAYYFKDKTAILLENKFPMLAVTKENDRLHMVIIYKIKNKKVYIGDPKKGKLKYKIDDFYKLWNGELLLVEGYSEAKKKFKANKDKSNLLFVLASGFFQIISFLALTIAIFFIDGSVSFLIPLCLFVAYILLEFIHKQITLVGMRVMDNHIYANLPKNTANLPHFYKNISYCKNHFFINPIQIIASFLSLALIVVALGLNSYLNIINLLIIAFFNVGFFIFFNHYIKAKEKLILENESLLNKGNLPSSDVEATLRLLNVETYKLSNILYFRRYILLIITILLCLFYAGFSDNISLNFILFHVFAYYLFIEILTNTLENLKKSSKKTYYKCIYRNYFQF